MVVFFGFMLVCWCMEDMRDAGLESDGLDVLLTGLVVSALFQGGT